MKKIFFAFFILSIFLLKSQANEKAINFNYATTTNALNNENQNFGDIFVFTYNNKLNDDSIKFYDDKEKIKIFDKPDLSWIQEKNRLEKLFIAIGVVSFTIGFSMCLAGILMLVIPNDAVKINGQWITNVENTYIAITAVGGGLMLSGIPFILVGSIRLGLAKQKEKQKTPADESVN